MKRTKKIALFIATLMLLVVCFAFGASAERAILNSGECGAEGDNVTWVLYDDGELVISGTGAMEDYHFDDLTSSASGSAPWAYRDVSTLTLKEGITTIGGGAFERLHNLKEVTIPSTVTEIKWRAFYECENLEKVTVGASVEKIYTEVFYGCSNLVEFIEVDTDDACCVENGVWFNKDKTELLAYPVGKTDIKYVIPDGVEVINNSAFHTAMYIQEVVIPDTVSEIGKYAFADCESLAKVNLPDGLTKINWCVFSNCSSLEAIVFPESLEEIGLSAFENCISLKEIILTDNITSIAYGAFNACFSVENIIFGDKTKVVPYLAFPGCENLKTITLGKNIKKVCAAAFYYCPALEEIIVSEDNKCFVFEDGVLYNKDKTELILYVGNAETTEFIIPDSVKKIQEGAFLTNMYLESVTVSEGIKTIPVGAFMNCKALKEVNLPESLEKIDWNAFDSCSSLESIRIPDNVRAIENEAFSYCSSLEDFNIPANLERMGPRVFYNSKWYENQETGILYKDNWVVGYKSGSGYNNNAVDEITIQEGTIGVAAELSYNVVGNIAKYGYIPSTVKYISLPFMCFNEFSVSEENPYYTVENNMLLTKDKKVLISYADDGSETVVVPDGVVEIADGAFYGATMKNVQLPSSLKVIGAEAFRYCRNLESVVIPEGVEYIKNGAFYENYKLAEISVPSTVEKMGGIVFQSTAWERNLPEGEVYLGTIFYDYIGNMPEGYNLVIKDGTTCVAGWVCMYQFGLKSVEMPDTVTYIGDGAFGQAFSLSRIKLSKNLKEIGNGAFVCTSGLTEIIYGGTKADWDKIIYNKEIWENEFFGQCCLFYDGEEIEHEHSYSESVTEPTCTEKGEKVYLCECGDKYTEEIVASGHSFTNYESNNDATCVADGTKTAKCDNCDATDTIADVGSKKGHSFTKYESNNDATCVADGTKTAKCDNCEEKDTIVDEGTIKGHSFTKYESNNDATCVADGTKTAKCDNCDATDTIADEGSKTPDTHKLTEWETIGNTQSRYCLVCTYKESKIVTESGDVEIEIPSDPDKDFEVDEVEKNSGSYIIIDEAIDNGVDGEYEIVKAFDINLTNKDGVHVQPDGTVKVKLPNDWTKKGNYKVYRVNDDGTLTDMNAYRQGSHMVFETDHFSVYVIVVEGEGVAEDEPETPAEPDTSDCGCICHKSGWFYEFLTIIFKFVAKIGGMFQICDCGIAHY